MVSGYERLLDLVVKGNSGLIGDLLRFDLPLPLIAAVVLWRRWLAALFEDHDKMIKRGSLTFLKVCPPQIAQIYTDRNSFDPVWGEIYINPGKEGFRHIKDH